jgi:hypothetical protein
VKLLSIGPAIITASGPPKNGPCKQLHASLYKVTFYLTGHSKFLVMTHNTARINGDKKKCESNEMFFNK